MKTIHKINILLLCLLAVIVLNAMSTKQSRQEFPVTQGDTAIIIDDGQTIRLKTDSEPPYEIVDIPGWWVDTPDSSFFVPDTAFVQAMQTIKVN